MPRRKPVSIAYSRKHSRQQDDDNMDDNFPILPPRKKIRRGASDESLKELARHAIRAMQERGLCRTTSPVRIINRPLSPGSFLKKVGLGDLHHTTRRRRSLPLLQQPEIDKTSDEATSKLTDASIITAPESPPLLETNSHRSPTGNITPATARAVLGLLDLRR